MHMMRARVLRLRFLLPLLLPSNRAASAVAVKREVKPPPTFFSISLAPATF